MFATATAPGFGLVHTQRKTKAGRVLPCRARRVREVCPHGVVLRCGRRHRDSDPLLGQPLCQRCYDYRHHVVWNSHAGELWRRTIGITANRLLAKEAKQHGDDGRVRLSYGKVAEYQRRGVVHFHGLIRLDGIDPDHPETRHRPAGMGHHLRARPTCCAKPSRRPGSGPQPHPANRDGWPIGWGEQLDLRPVRMRGDDAITDTAVAGYLAKYATKSTDTTGHVSARITRDTIKIYADQSHPGRLIHTAWQLGQADDYDRLRRWAHMLGFGGHFFSKSKRYSTTFKVLRNARGPTSAAGLAANAPTPSWPTSTTRTPPSSSTTSPSPASAGTPPATPCSPTPARPWPASDDAPRTTHWQQNPSQLIGKAPWIPEQR